MSSTLPKKSSKKSATQLIVIAALALFVAVSALPQYFGDWPWATPPKLQQATRSALQALPEEGIDLPGWVTNEQTKTKFGGHAWSVQQISVAANKTETNTASQPTIPVAFILLRPQIYEDDQPEVEWIDIKGSQGWSTDSSQNISFEVPLEKSGSSQTVTVKSNFFRAWNQTQTYAVLQWYAWADGGSPSPANWFWADQKAQWRHYQRMPWTAVNIWLPIEPLSDIAPHQTTAIALGKSLQATLSEMVFQAVPADTATEQPDG
ncbi:MAG: cyanoexosortase B system-associated protein [Phormidesmis sp.]